MAIHMLLLFLTASAARAEFCATKPDKSIPDTADMRWQSQLVVSIGDVLKLNIGTLREHVCQLGRSLAEIKLMRL